MKNVIVAWDEPTQTEQWKSFKTSLIGFLKGVEDEDFKTDEDHIFFLSYKQRLDELVERRDECDLVICSEDFDGERIGTGTLKRWRKANSDVKVILVLDNEKMGSSKVMGLYEQKYYNALFMKDFRANMIKSLVTGERSKDEAFTYYGLEDYVDLRKVKKKQEDAHEIEVIERPLSEIVAEDEYKAARLEELTESYQEELEEMKDLKTLEMPKDEPEKKPGELTYDASYPDLTTVSQEEAEIYRFLQLAESEAVADVEEVYELSRIDEVQEDLLHYYTRVETSYMSNLEAGLLSRQEWDHEVWQKISTYEDLTKEQRQEVHRRFSAFMWSQDILDPFVNDVAISDIKLLGPNHIRIKKHGERFAAPVRFRSKEHYNAFVSHLAKRNATTLEDAIVRFTDSKSSEHAKLRTNIMTEFIAVSGYPVVHFRLVPKIKYKTMQLIRAGMFSPGTAKYLIEAVRKKKGLIICGQNAAGKSTLMNWALEFIPHNRSVYVIQESEELFSDTHPEFVCLSPREFFSNYKKLADENERVKKYALKDLTVNALLTDNDYIVIGEIKNEEARYFTNAAYTGSVCWATVHASNAKAALPKIADYAVSKSKDDANFSYSKEDMLQMMSSLEVVVFIERFKVKEICEVTGWDDKKKQLIYKSIPVDEGDVGKRRKS